MSSTPLTYLQQCLNSGLKAMLNSIFYLAICQNSHSERLKESETASETDKNRISPALSADFIENSESPDSPYSPLTQESITKPSMRIAFHKKPPRGFSLNIQKATIIQRGPAAVIKGPVNLKLNGASPLAIPNSPKPSAYFLQPINKIEILIVEKF